MLANGLSLLPSLVSLPVAATHNSSILPSRLILIFLVLESLIKPLPTLKAATPLALGLMPTPVSYTHLRAHET